MDKIQGMLTGSALGDALGAPHEFRYSLPLSEYTGKLEYHQMMVSRFHGKRFGAIAQVSDDTELVLALANSLIRKRKYDRNDVILSYEEWANSKPIGMGVNTRNLFYGVKTVSGFEDRRVKFKPTQSNGSLMRSSPLFLLDPESQIADVQLTNPGNVNEFASLIYLNTLRRLYEYESIDNIFKFIYEKKEACPGSIQDALEQLEDEHRKVDYSKGWVVHCLYASLLGLKYFQKFGTFHQAIDKVILLGGDTDTNACVAGALIGMKIGFKGLLKEPITRENIKILFDADTRQGDFPRPNMYHPSTIPYVSKRLWEIFG